MLEAIHIPSIRPTRPTEPSTTPGIVFTPAEIVIVGVAVDELVVEELFLAVVLVVLSPVKPDPSVAFAVVSAPGDVLLLVAEVSVISPEVVAAPTSAGEAVVFDLDTEEVAVVFLLVVVGPSSPPAEQWPSDVAGHVSPASQ